MISEIFRTYVAGLLSPTFFTGLCLILGTILLWKNKLAGKILVTISAVLFILISTAPLRYSFYKITETDPSPIPQDYKYVVVLGGKITPNADHPVASQISGTLLSRLSHGISLVQARPGSILIVTGKPEQELMEKYALQMGVPKERLIVEKESVNTMDHPKYLLSILKDQKFVLVTSANHMKRSLSNFEALGLHGYPAPTDYANKKDSLDLESLIMKGENFAMMDKWFTELYSTMWTYVRRAFNI